ncbi:hypothetical protein V1478_009727 [Vespula squamosa]|uniref:Uncharacterized protein n=1 Tax=Vespula squamosa TaxID=30214 RepID=A0ABD2AQH0_VESSQ
MPRKNQNENLPNCLMLRKTYKFAILCKIMLPKMKSNMFVDWCILRNQNIDNIITTEIYLCLVLDAMIILGHQS